MVQVVNVGFANIKKKKKEIVLGWKKKREEETPRDGRLKSSLIYIP